MPYKNKEKNKEYQKIYARQNHVKEKRHGRAKKLKKERRQYCANIALNKKCVVCKYNKCSEALDFHHIDPEQKICAVSQMVANLASYENIDKEIAKCVVICARCHREFHAGIIKLPV